MISVTFKSVVYGIASELGWTPYSENGITSEQFRELTNFINDRVEQGWRFAWWNDAMVCEERTVTTGADDVRYAAWEETGLTPIGDVFGVYEENPLVTEYCYHIWHGLNADGVVVNSDAPSTVFILFRKEPPVFSAEAYNSGESYDEGDVCYDPDAGECYKSLADGNQGNALTDTAYWEKVRFPSFLAVYVKKGVYADKLPEGSEGIERAEGKANAQLHVLAAAGQYVRAEVKVC